MSVTLSTVTTAGVSAATDLVGTDHYQQVKIVLGTAGTSLGNVSSANPMPVVNSAAVTVTGSVGISGPVTVSGSVSIAGPTTVTGSVTAAITGPVTVTGTVAATQSGAFSVIGGVTAAITGPVTVTGSVGISGPVTVTGSVTSAITGPVTVTGAVSVIGSLSASINNLLGATVVAGTTVTGTIAVGKRVDTQATVGSAVNTAAPLHVNEFGSLWVSAEAGDAQVTNGGGVTGIQVFVGNATTVGTTVIASISGPMTVTGSVGISGPVTVTGSVTSAITGPVTVTGSVGISGPVTVTGTVGISGGVQGVTAHGTVAAGNPVLVGWQALAADQTAVTTTGVTKALATLLGKVVNHPYALPAQYTSYAAVTAGLATTVAATAFASAGASTRWYLTSAQFINQGAAVTRAILQDGAGAIYYTASLATSGGGVSATFPVPLRIAANQTVEIKLDTTGTTVFTNLQGFKAAE